VGHRKLEDLQRLVADSIRLGDMLDDRTLRAEQFLVPSKRGQSVASRLNVYREQYWLRHLANLTDDYPTLAWVVGPEGFRELVTGYLAAFPPRTWNLQRLGADVPAYVADRAPWKKDPLVLDASVLDWAFMEAFDAPDAAPLDLRALVNATAEAWTQARIELHPSVKRVALSHRVHDLRDAVRLDRARDRPAQCAVHVVVWRDAACLLRAQDIDPAAFDLLGHLSRGTAIGEACEAVAGKAELGDVANLSASVGEWFRQWTANGWVSAVRLDS
jgi:hypothetical protein